MKTSFLFIFAAVPLTSLNPGKLTVRRGMAIALRDWNWNDLAQTTALAAAVFFILALFIFAAKLRRSTSIIKLAAEEKTDLAALLSAALESTADGLLVINSDGIRTCCNQRFIEMWQIPRDIIDDHDDEKMYAHMLAQLSSPETFSAEIQGLGSQSEAISTDMLYLSDGRIFERYSQPQRQEQQIIGRVWRFRDITEQKRSEDELRASESRYRSVITVSNTGVWEYQRENKYLWCSPEYFEMIGHNPADYPMDGRANIDEVWINHLHPEDRQHTVNQSMAYLANGSDGMYESCFRMKHLDGSWVWICARGQTLRNPDGSLSSLTVGTNINITGRKQIETQLSNEKEQFKTTLLSVSDGVISTDVQGRAAIMNKVAEQLTGWTQEEAAGRPIDEVFSIVNEFTRERCTSPVATVLLTKESIDLANHTLLVSKDGTERPIEDSAAPIVDAQGCISGVVLVFRDITEKKKRLDEIRYLSFYDHLTGLYNRRFYEAECDRLDKERNWPLTIVLGDVNGLKLINDSLGHAAGDQILVKTAKAIKKACRADDIVARIGGDEFAVLLPETDGFEAAQLVNRIKVLLKEETSGDLEISVSFGYETKTSETDAIEAVSKKAEDTMYHNKLFERPSIRGKAIENIIAALNSKSKKEEAHSKRVSDLCEKMGTALGMEEYKIKEMKAFGLLHDIGKIALSEKTLNKSGMLTEYEWLEMKSHSEIGFRILNTNNDMAEIAEYVLAHHERWDGKGYPKGLKEQEIPIPSRICAITDAYDAMISNRSYRLPLTKDAALAELRINAGTQFDPELVRLFADIVERDTSC